MAQTRAEKQVVPELTMPDAKQMILHLFTNELTKHEPILVIGESGIGKTAVTRQIAEELGWDYLDIRMAGVLSEDVKGIPQVETWMDGYYKQALTKTEEVFTPNIKNVLMSQIAYAFSHPGPGILDFEEINRAPSDTINALFQLVGDRTLDEKRLPDGWRIIGSINPGSNSDYIVNEFDIAFKRRWMMIKVRPDINSFLKYAKSAHFNEAVISYLTDFPKFFYDRLGDDVFLMPATWERVSRVLDSFDDTMSESVQRTIIDSMVGFIIGEKLMEHYKQLCKKTFSHSDIYNRYTSDSKIQSYVKKLSTSGNLSELSSLCVGLVTGIKEANVNTLTFMLDLPLDLQQRFITDIHVQGINIPMENKEIELLLEKIMEGLENVEAS